MIIIRPRKYTLWERVYLFEVARGMSVTMRHFMKNIWGALIHDRVIETCEYPEEPSIYPARARNVHRLVLRDDGAPQCVACLMCETICPAQCISIVAEESPDPVIEKRCKEFVIDELRCIFCGYCVEACPKDAIRMDTAQAALSEYKRQDFIFDRETLLGHERRRDIDEGEQ
jgi:NADH-quinone oxidoreductase subunit I